LLETLPRRERDIFLILCRLERPTASDIRAALPDELSDSTVRTLLRRLVDKGVVQRHLGKGSARYSAVSASGAVAEGALQRIVDTFFGGSALDAASALLGLSARLEPDEAEKLRQLIEKSRKAGS